MTGGDSATTRFCLCCLLLIKRVLFDWEDAAHELEVEGGSADKLRLASCKKSMDGMAFESLLLLLLLAETPPTGELAATLRKCRSVAR
jgi:hypothetical protein